MPRKRETYAKTALLEDSDDEIRELETRQMARGKLRQRAFLAAFRETGSVTVAARAARVSKNAHVKWMKDPEYAAEFEKARAEAAQSLEDEAVRRAREGWKEPVFYRGKICGYTHRYSDPLLMFLLRGWQPARYRDRTEISGPEGGPIRIDQKVVALAKVLTVDELNELRSRLEAVDS